jgi:hypothetical protein
MEAYLYDRHFKWAVEHNICIVNEEFGFQEGNRPDLTPGQQGYDPGFPQCMKDYLELMNKYSIPWNEYCWWIGGYGLTSDWVNLNIVGQIWVKYLTPTPPLKPVPTPKVLALPILRSLFPGIFALWDRVRETILGWGT